MAKRLVPANGRRLAALALLGALCACATTSAGPPPEAQPAGWRIVERIGEARYSPPGNAAWTSATVGEMLADASEVSTGRGGRLIVDAPGRHISVGPDSRFVLPDPEREDPLNQRAGWLRYRIAAAEAQPFRIRTRSLEVEVLAGVVDVHVNHLATEVTVKEGQVRVATPDGLRQTQMMAGQSAHAGGSDGVQLAVRLAPGAALQRVDPVIIPALRPESRLPEMPETRAPAVSPPAGPPPPPPGHAAASANDRAAHEAPLMPRRGGAAEQARPHNSLQASRPAVRSPSGTRLAAADEPGAATTATAQREVGRAGAPGQKAPPVESRPDDSGGTAHPGKFEPHPDESAAAAIRRGKFERLTAGMLDQVKSRNPAPVRP